ncbi:enolase [Firmicutes bacterium CAG:321]|nr:enolase [Firmicutes bacterium CAG:321]
MSKIKNIYAREILDSRGNPTVEVELTLESGIKAVASVPSGASTGKNEALELRDNDKNRYHGKGVLKAINNVNNIIKPLLIGKDSLNQEEIDRIMLEKDGTENKEVLGANAILGVSLANLKTAAKYKGLELYEYLGKEYSMPRCMMNILNGGVHASNNLDFQEFMIVPNKEEYHENLRMGSEVFNTLKNVLKERNLLCGVGDEGGFAPQINDAKEALELIKEAITKSGYELGKDINIALDVAASEFYNEEEDIYLLEGVKYTKEELVSYYQSLVDKYHIISIEDGMAEEDYEGWKLLTSKLSNIQLVGDDLFVTNKKLLQKGIDMHIANAILIKLNQIGTVTETLETIKLARDNNYKTIISHRSGETEDNYISDFAVGLNLGQIKTGSMSRGERLSKYNRLLRIEEQVK